MKSSVLILVCVLITSCTNSSIEWKREKKVSLSEEDLLILTERAFLEGYATGWYKGDYDSAWVPLSDKYCQIFN